MSTSPMHYDVFLSHNSADYFAAVALEQRLARARVRPWLAASQLIPGRPWQEAMERALAQSETVAVIIGPQGMGPWHNEQMRVAIDDAVRQGKGVIPVLLPGADLERINPFLKRRTWVDFRGGLENEAAFQLLLAGIRGEAPFEAGDLFGLAWARRKDFYRHIPYPPNYVPRPELLAEVRQALLAETTTLALTSAIKMDALHGMGGIGKSVMARALCDDPEVQAAFPDGILWAGVGQTPDLLARLREWIDALGGIISEMAPTVDRLKAILADLLRERACLLIADDVWKKAHAEAFRVGGPRCRLLITTRDAAVAEESGADVHPIPVMTEAEALDLLDEWAGDGLLDAISDVKTKIVRRLGRLPLAIKLAGAQLHRKGPMPWLETFDATKLTMRRIEDIHDSLTATFALSLGDLDPTDRRLYVSLAIFKEDESTPVVAITKLWSALAELDAEGSKELLDELAARALLQRNREENDTIAIHDMMRDFMVRNQSKADRVAAHQAILAAYRQDWRGTGWHTLPYDGYLHTHLTWHLEEANEHSQLHLLLAETTEQGRNGWYETLEQLQLIDHYVEDVRRAWKAAVDSGNMGLQVRYALIESTMHSLAQQLPVELYIAVLRYRSSLFSARAVLKGVAQMPLVYQRSDALFDLAPHLPVEVLPDALKMALLLAGENERGLLGLAPHLPAELLVLALRDLPVYVSDFNQARFLALIAHTIPDFMLDMAICAARQINRSDCRAYALGSLIARLSGDIQAEVIGETLDAVSQDSSFVPFRANALVSLSPFLARENLLRQLQLLEETLKRNEGTLEAALFPGVELAQAYLAAGELDKFYGVVDKVFLDETLLEVVGESVPLLKPDDVSRLFDHLACRRTGYGWSKSLGSLLEYGPESLQSRVIELTKRHDLDFDFKVTALAHMAPHVRDQSCRERLWMEVESILEDFRDGPGGLLALHVYEDIVNLLPSEIVESFLHLGQDEGIWYRWPAFALASLEKVSTPSRQRISTKLFELARDDWRVDDLSIKMLAKLTPYISADEREELFRGVYRSAKFLTDEDHDDPLAPFKIVRNRKWVAIYSSGYFREYDRIRVLLQMIPHLDEPTDIAHMTCTALENLNPVRFHHLIPDIVPILRCLEPNKRAVMTKRILDNLEEVDRHSYQRVDGRLLEDIQVISQASETCEVFGEDWGSEPDLYAISDALHKASAMKHRHRYRDRPEMVLNQVAAWCRLPTAAALELWHELLPLFAEDDRQHFLWDLHSMAPVILRLGGEAAMLDVIDEVERITVWWS